MDNERLRILKMLEEGKITADEAARLMDTSKSVSRYDDAPGNNNGAGRRGVKSETGFDDFTSDLSRKFEMLAKDLEPKLQKITGIVVEKTAGMADKISQSIERERPKMAGAAAQAVSRGRERSFELIVKPGANELYISGMNGDVTLKGYNGDKISLKVSCRAKPLDADITFSQFGNKYRLVYDENQFESVAVDAFVPSNMFDFVVVETVNGRLSLSDIVSKSGKFDNFNGDVTVNNVDIEHMKLSTANGGVSLNMRAYDAFISYVWAVEASNGRLSLNLPSAPEYGYHMRAHAALGSIRMGLVGLNYLANDSSNMEVKSINYDNVPKHIKVSLETSNEAIIVN